MTGVLIPATYWCDYCEDEVLTETERYCGVLDVERCMRCGCIAEAVYVCPGCGKDTFERDMLSENCDLCKECYKAEIMQLEKEVNPRRIELIKFLRELE